MVQLSKLRWQCRRGTLELDILLTRYLETCFQSAEQKEQEAFLHLLELEDTQLLPYLMGKSEPDLQEMQHLINKIRNISPTEL